MMPDDHISIATRPEPITLGFGNAQNFEFTQRAANALMKSTLVPETFRKSVVVKKAYGDNPAVYEENPNALSNCIIALNMADRLRADVLMIMQNLYVVEGRPSWSAQFVIAAINSCGRFSPLRFDITEPGEEHEVEYESIYWENRTKKTRTAKVTIRDRTCRAWAIEKATGDRLDGPEVSINMAVLEGWLTKNGSKWQTMPEVMLRYRSAAFFGRLYAPELLMGLHTEDEERDTIIDVTPASAPPRPTRETFVPQESTVTVTEEEKIEVSADIVEQADASTERDPELFAFVDTDGVEHEVDGSTYGNRFFNALKSAVSQSIAHGLWETNSSQLERFRIEFESGPKFAEAIDQAYGEALARCKAASQKEVEQKTADPEQALHAEEQGAVKDTRPHAPRHFGKVPRKGDGTFDWAKFCQQFGNLIEKSETVDDLTNWQRINMNAMEQAATAAPEAYSQLQTRITATRQWMDQ